MICKGSPWQPRPCPQFRGHKGRRVPMWRFVFFCFLLSTCFMVHKVFFFNLRTSAICWLYVFGDLRGIKNWFVYFVCFFCLSLSLLFLFLFLFSFYFHSLLLLFLFFAFMFIILCVASVATCLGSICRMCECVCVCETYGTHLSMLIMSIIVIIIIIMMMSC